MKKKEFTIKISNLAYITILLKFNQTNKIKINRVYFFDVKNQVLIDETFDKFYAQNKIK